MTHPLALAFLALLMLVPVTLPVAALRPLVQERYAVSEVLTALFMTINMVGAVLAAPIAGALADRGVRARDAITLALLVDAACFALLATPLSYPVFMSVRFVEGCAHITALSLLFAVAAAHGGEDARARRMAALGAGLTLGVALGAPLGGVLAKEDVLRPLWVASLWLVATALFAYVVLPRAALATRKAAVGAALRTVLAHAELRLPLAYAFVDRFTVGFFVSCFPLYLSGVHGASPPRIGALLALFLIPFALLSYPCGRFAARGRVFATVVFGSTAYGIGAATLGWWSPDALGWLMVFLGLSSAVMFVPSILLTQTLAPTALRGTALGAFHAAGSLGFIAGPLVGAQVAQAVAASHGAHAGYRTAFVVAGASVIGVVLATLPGLARLRRAGRIDTEPGSTPPLSPPRSIPPVRR